MTFTILVMILVIVWACKTIIKELEIGDILKERTTRRKRDDDDD